MDVSIVVVSWNVRDLLRRCLRSIAAEASGALPDAASLSIETFVVDNASTDGTLDLLRDEYPGVRLIANSENLGFTRANNKALAQAQGRYLFLLNPDTELGSGVLSSLTAYLDANSQIGIVGPRLVYADGTPQSSRRRFPTLATFFLESTKLQQWFPHNRVLTRYYMLDTPDDAIQPVDWVNGSAMFVRRQVYDQIGGFDERFFMYSEELDWCYRAKRAGWQIAYFPSARVAHHEARSSEQAPAARDVYFHTSKIQFVNKYHGAVAAGLLRAFLLLMFAYQIAEESGKWILGHRRALRAARVKAYRTVLASGMRPGVRLRQ